MLRISKSLWRIAIVIGAAAGSALLGAACSCASDAQSATGGAGGTSTGAGGQAGHAGAGTGGEGAGINLDGGGECSENGQACGDGGICAGGQCCEAVAPCANACCGPTEVCSFGQCVTPGADCATNDDCAGSEYCERALGAPGAEDAGVGGGCVGGSAQPTGKCLPKPPVCSVGQEPGDPPTCLQACSYTPPAPSFGAQEKYSWGGHITPPYDTDIMMTPIVLQLDDDNCDGLINERDIPEIVFSTFSSGDYNGAGVLHAIGVVGGVLVEKWNVPGVLMPAKQIAGGNIDGVPGNEVVGCGSDGAVHAFKGDGTPLWTSAAMTCLMPSIADLDQDGAVEVIVEGGILDGATGTLKHAFSEPLAGAFVVSDIDGDGRLDVVTGSQGFDASGQKFVDTGLANTGSFYGTADWKSPWPAVGNLDLDGKPEVVVMHNQQHELSVWRYDASAPQKFVVVRPPVDINGVIGTAGCPVGSWGNTHGGGPPTIADFNGDGHPDVALAGGVGYAVFDGAKLMNPAVAGPDTFLWLVPTFDCSSASTGSTVFDFNGDGVSEVVYSDQLHLRIYDGPTGTVLLETCNTTATLIENPVVADVDNDGHAEIVAVSNAYGFTCDDGVSDRQAGIRVFGDPSGAWVRTRRVWNEHAYHVTNVNEDGTIPQIEAENFATTGLNNFRQNKQPGSEFAAPDAVVSVAPLCSGSDYALAARVQNLGEAALPAGVVVGFYYGTPPTGTNLGYGATTKVLYPLEGEQVVLPVPSAPAEVLQGTVPIYAVVDDTATPHPQWTECRTDNNTSAAVSGACSTVN